MKSDPNQMDLGKMAAKIEELKGRLEIAHPEAAGQLNPIVAEVLQVLAGLITMMLGGGTKQQFKETKSHAHS